MLRFFQKREDLLRDLSCADEDQTTTTFGTSSTAFWSTTTDLSNADQESNNEISTEESGIPVHENVNKYVTSKSLSFVDFSNESAEKISHKQLKMAKELHKVPLEKNINFDVVNSNNLQSNDVHEVTDTDEFYINEHAERLEDEKNMQHKKLHDELARLGNFETIFNQPTDHFVPPLVMAKAKLSDDMTALSIEEKLAQQLAERQFRRHDGMQSDSSDIKYDPKEYSSSETLSKIVTTENPVHTVSSSTKLNDVKMAAPKKYSNKYGDTKSKILKTITIKSTPSGKVNNIKSSTPMPTTDIFDTTTIFKSTSQKSSYKENTDKDPSLELTVIIKETEPNEKNKSKIFGSDFEIDLQNTTNSNENISSIVTDHHVIMNDEVIKIEIVNEKDGNHSNIDITVYEVTTKVPSFKGQIKKDTTVIPNDDNSNVTIKLGVALLSHDNITTFPGEELITSSTNTADIINKTDSIQSTEESLITVISDLNPESNVSMFGNIGKTGAEDVATSNVTILKEKTETLNETDLIYRLEQNNTNETPEIDDYNSPLLSAANEPLHRPTRSRRPQSLQNRANKFNPFRMLG